MPKAYIVGGARRVVGGKSAVVNPDCCCGQVGSCVPWRKCFVECGNCPEIADYELPRLEDVGGGCLRLVNSPNPSCNCCGVGVGETAVVTITTESKETLRALVRMFESRPSPIGCQFACSLQPDGWDHTGFDFFVRSSRRIEFIGLGLNQVQVVSDVETVTITETIREFDPNNTLPPECEPWRSRIIERTETTTSTNDFGVGIVPINGRLVPSRPEIQFAAGFVFDANGCFVGSSTQVFPGIDENDGTNTWIRRGSLFVSCDRASAQSSSQETLVRDIPPVEDDCASGPGYPGAVEIARLVERSHTYLISKPSCNGTPSDQFCNPVQSYASRKCDDDTPGPLFCRSYIDLFGFPGNSVVRLNGCCYEVLVQDGPVPSHGVGEGVIYPTCERCLSSLYWRLERCDGLPTNGVVLAGAWDLYSGNAGILRGDDGVCYQVFEGESVPLEGDAVLVGVSGGFDDCERCQLEGENPVFLATRRCDDQTPGPSVRNYAPGQVVKIADVCYEVLDQDGDPQDEQTPSDVFSDCESCAGPQELCFAYRLPGCNGLLGGVGCRSPLELFAPPVITYDKSDQPPGDDTLFLAGACGGYFFCYRASEDPATEPIIPPPPTRLAWSTELICSNSGEQPACCTVCPCGDCSDIPQRTDGRPFEIPFPNQFGDNATELAGTWGLF
jgi:hypothetical protein